MVRSQQTWHQAARQRSYYRPVGPVAAPREWRRCGRANVVPVVPATCSRKLKSLAGPPPPAQNHYALSMADAIELLSKVPLFATVSHKDLRFLAKVAHDMSYEDGAHLTSQDEMGVTFFVVVEGEAEVTVRGHARRRLGPGEYFGEMSIIDRSPRSADVVAGPGLRCLVFTQWEFRPFLQEHPDVAWAMLEVLVRRLREVEKAAPGES